MSSSGKQSRASGDGVCMSCAHRCVCADIVNLGSRDTLQWALHLYDKVTTLSTNYDAAMGNSEGATPPVATTPPMARQGTGSTDRPCDPPREAQRQEEPIASTSRPKTTTPAPTPVPASVPATSPEASSMAMQPAEGEPEDKTQSPSCSRTSERNAGIKKNLQDIDVRVSLPCGAPPD